jgi:hypothetical protein
MPFDWRGFVELARELGRQARDSTNPEAWWRSALSRVYFAVYCHARNYAERWLGFQPKEDADDHGRVKALLKQKRRHADSDRLERLRQWRNDCDYRNDLTIDPEAALETALELADRTFASLLPPRRA